MKKLSTAVLFFMLLVPAVCAKEVDGGFFVADIPSGWTMKKQPPAVILAQARHDRHRRESPDRRAQRQGNSRSRL